ncbi:protein of unknown function [uncultured Sphingopyxis sp.]|uniref:Uncharacterized protein n=1 Tax=uncultured Sphingopyxis sp. TaxID=310581 RepID=A0A1Y5PMX9_9SPHN|nr:protein of unknown function [uncultured Sphingopyxis sp.]
MRPATSVARDCPSSSFFKWQRAAMNGTSFADSISPALAFHDQKSNTPRNINSQGTQHGFP